MGLFVFGTLLVIGGIAAIIFCYASSKKRPSISQDELYRRLTNAITNIPVGRWYTVENGNFKVRVVARTSDICAVESENVQIAIHGAIFITCVAFDINTKTGLRFMVTPVYTNTPNNAYPGTVRLIESFKDANYPVSAMAEDAALRLVKHLEEAVTQNN